MLLEVELDIAAVLLNRAENLEELVRRLRCIERVCMGIYLKGFGSDLQDPSIWTRSVGHWIAHFWTAVVALLLSVSTLHVLRPGRPTGEDNNVVGRHLYFSLWWNCYGRRGEVSDVVLVDYLGLNKMSHLHPLQTPTSASYAKHTRPSGGDVTSSIFCPCPLQV